MKQLIITMVFLLLSYTTSAQTYKGAILDSQKQPIAYANVIARSSIEGHLITGVVSDEQGQFKMLVDTKKPFIITISFIGYDSWAKNIVSSSSTDLGVITLNESRNELEAVVLTVKRPVITRTGDRLVFNVQNSVVSQGYNATEVIKNVPRIDPTSDALKIIGKSSVMVLVNNRLINLEGSDLTAYLKSLRSENIARIEVMTIPPAKYDAAANSGLINIILKKNIDLGFDGTVTYTHIQRTKPGIMPSASLRYSSKKLSTSLNIFADRETKIYDLDANIDYTTRIRKSTVKREDDTKGISSGLSVDYQLNNMSRIGIVLNGSFWDTEQNTKAKTFFKNSIQNIDSTQNLPSNNKNQYDYLALSAYYDITLDTLGKTLKFNYNRLQKNNEDNRNLVSTGFNGDFGAQTNYTSANNISKAVYSASSVNADLELPFSNFKMEFGGKWTALANDSEIQYFDTSSAIPFLDINQSNTFRYDETIWAAYASLEKSWNDKLYSKIGIRYETTSAKGYSISQNNTFTNSFENFFPSIFLSYQLNNSHAFSLAYNKRIDRPVFYDVNPFRSYINFYNYIEGNPKLQPSITNNIEFSYTLKNNLSLITYASFLKNGSEYLTITSDDDLFIISRPENYYNQHTLGLDLSYSFKPFKNFNSYNSFSIYYNSSESKLPQYTIPDLKGYGYFLSTSNTWNFNKKRNNRLYLNFYQKFPSTEGLTTISNRASLKLGCIVNFFDKNLTLNISVNDIFKQSYTKTTENYPGYTWKSNQYSDQQNLNFTVTYKFGNNKFRNSKRSIDDSDKSRFN